MNFAKMLFVGLSILFLVACGTDDNSQESITETSKSFVQALINADEETLGKINRDINYPSDYLITNISPKYSDFTIDEITIEIDEEKNEVLISHVNNDETIRYWLTIEKIDGKYFVTKIV